MTRVVARIDAAALAHNLDLVRRAAPASRVCAVVKADAYGHGLVEAARALGGADGYGVACVEEALTLRESGVAAPVLVLEGVTDGRELAEARRAKLEVAVHAGWQLDLLERDGAQGLARLWIKFDTGMHRLGFPPDSAEEVRARLAALGIAAPGLMSHLACADEPERPETAHQVEAFQRLRKIFTGPGSLANSAGVLAHPAAHYDWVRPGLMLYGVSPFPGKRGASLGLEPAMTFASRIVAVRDVVAGEAVGYGGDWKAPRSSRIATVSAGYGDGYPWRAARSGVALVHGRRAPLAGRVSMDLLALDVTEIQGAAPGDEVTLWGADLPVEQVARVAGTSPYELVTTVTPRVPRIYEATTAPVQSAAG